MLLAIVAALLAQEPKFDAMSYVRAHRGADAALVAGKLDDARKGFEASLAMSPRNSTVAYALACTEARATNSVKALEWLDRAVEWGYADADVAIWDTDLASLRHEQRFVAACEHMRSLLGERTEPPWLVGMFGGTGSDMYDDLAIDPRGRWVAVGRRNGVIQILDPRTGHELRRSPDLGSEVWTMDVDKSGERVAALTWDGKLHLWAVDGASKVNSRQALPQAKANPLMEDSTKFSWTFGAFLQFDPSGERLLVAACDRGAALFSMRGEAIHSWNEMPGFFSPMLAWSPDGARIAMPSGSRVDFFDGRTGESADAPLETPAPICSLGYQPGGHLFATGHEENRLRVWDLQSKKLVTDHFFKDLFDQALTVNSIAFSPDGRWVAASTGTIVSVVVIEASTGTVSASLETGGGRMGEPYELQWSPDSHSLWCAFASGVMQVDELVIGAEARQRLGFSARAPRIGKSGLSIANGLANVFALDGASGRCLWDRPAIGREGELLKASTGHFTADLESLDGILIQPDPSSNDTRPLAEFATLLFDPKRVRAARDGVALVPVKF